MNDAISKDLYVKPTDGHQYLHGRSSHPEYIKIRYRIAKRLG